MKGRREAVYRHRLMGALIGVLVLMILFVHWKGTPRDASLRDELQFRNTREVVLELPPTTTHERVPSAPSRPRMPVPVPSDEVVRDPVELSDAEWVLDEVPEIGEGTGASGESEIPVSNPDRPARITHIVEPPRSDIPEPFRGEIIVHVRVVLNASGEVVTTTLESIENRNGDSVETTEEAWITRVLEAASKWRFRPAEHQGRNVWTETVIPFYL